MLWYFNVLCWFFPKLPTTEPVLFCFRSQPNLMQCKYVMTTSLKDIYVRPETKNLSEKAWWALWLITKTKGYVLMYVKIIECFNCLIHVLIVLWLLNLITSKLFVLVCVVSILPWFPLHFPHYCSLPLLTLYIVYEIMNIYNIYSGPCLFSVRTLQRSPSIMTISVLNQRIALIYLCI